MLVVRLQTSRVGPPGVSAAVMLLHDDLLPFCESAYIIGFDIR